MNKIIEPVRIWNGGFSPYGDMLFDLVDPPRNRIYFSGGSEKKRQRSNRYQEVVNKYRFLKEIDK